MLYTIQQAAVMCTTSDRKIYQLMRKHGLFHAKEGEPEYNTPVKQLVARGYFVVEKRNVRKPNDQVIVKKKAKVTEIGILFIKQMMTIDQTLIRLPQSIYLAATHLLANGFLFTDNQDLVKTLLQKQLALSYSTTSITYPGHLYIVMADARAQADRPAIIARRQKKLATEHEMRDKSA